MTGAGGLDAARTLLAGCSQILVFTGAGLSTESGIPDFRGPDGLWTKVDPDDFTIQRYRSSPDVRRRGWSMHARGELWGARSNVQPNQGHLAIAALWRAQRMSGCITQNVDGLHLAAGLPEEALAEIHGHVRTVRCLTCASVAPTETVLTRVDGGDDDPRCSCGGLLKTSTVMFGEMLPFEQIEKAQQFAERADAVVAVGTTLSVFPAAEFALEVARRGRPFVIVNQGVTDADHLADVTIDAGAGETLNALFSA